MRYIQKFYDGIGFSFWHHFESPHGTAIRCRRMRYSRMIGFKINREHCGSSFQIGLWWAIDLSLVAVPQSRFKPDAKQAIAAPSTPRPDLEAQKRHIGQGKGGAE